MAPGGLVCTQQGRFGGHWRQAKGFGGRHPLVETQRLIGEAALKRTDQTIAASIQPALSRFRMSDADFNRWF